MFLPDGSEVVSSRIAASPGGLAYHSVVVARPANAGLMELQVAPSFAPQLVTALDGSQVPPVPPVVVDVTDPADEPRPALVEVYGGGPDGWCWWCRMCNQGRTQVDSHDRSIGEARGHVASHHSGFGRVWWDLGRECSGTTGGWKLLMRPDAGYVLVGPGCHGEVLIGTDIGWATAAERAGDRITSIERLLNGATA